MDDVREVGAELHRLAEADVLDPFDPAAMIQRGRRTQRRRKLFAGGAAVTGVAVVALVAALLPNLGGDRNQQVATPPPPQNPLFEPVPGAAYGEAGADQEISIEDAAKRCALRYPEVKESLTGKGPVKTGTTVSLGMKDHTMSGTCKIPGGDKPTAALLAAVAKDPVPATDAGKLRNCSVLLWVDLTNWTVVAADQSKRLGSTTFVAISPSGKKAATCQLDPDEMTSSANSQVLTLDPVATDGPVLDPAKGSQPASLFAASGGGGTLCVGAPCKDNYNFTAWGRVATTATKVVLRLGPGPVHEVPVKDGWFAVTWLSPTASDKIKPSLIAYDKDGKVVKVLAK